MARVTGGAPEDAADRYGVIGHPVSHSWSPFIHGMFAQQTGQHIVYKLFDVAPADFEREAVRLFTSGVRGLNVTIPHKQAACGICAELTARARRAQAVNTIVMRPDGTLLGDNTDGAGLVNDLLQNLGLDLRGASVLMLGAGGAARGVVGPLLGQGVYELTIANRNEARAHELRDAFSDVGRVMSCSFDAIRGRAFDLVVNATAASLQGEMPALPDGLVGTDTVCYDMAYGRGPTPFTEWATAQHARLACKGWGMLVEQAAISFSLWRSVRPQTAPVLQALAEYR